jgi:hypothetical protein
MLCRKCLLKQVTEGKIELKGGLGRRRKQLLDDLKETTGYWTLEVGALDRTVWRTGFGKGCGTVVMTDWEINE